MKYNLTQPSIDIISGIVGYQCNNESASKLLDTIFTVVNVDEVRELNPKVNVYVLTELYTDKTYHLLYKYNTSFINNQYISMTEFNVKLLVTYTYTI